MQTVDRERKRGHEKAERKWRHLAPTAQRLLGEQCLCRKNNQPSHTAKGLVFCWQRMQMLHEIQYSLRDVSPSSAISKSKVFERRKVAKFGSCSGQ